MENMTCLVTGANSGLGYAMTLELAKTGANVVMLCRNPRKGRKARIELIAKSQNPNIDLMVCDLANMQDIRRFVAEFKSYYGSLSILANLAGVYYPKKKITVEGLEVNFATNVLGPYLLTNLLIDSLMNEPYSKIINVSSESHRLGNADFSDPHFEQYFYSSSQSNSQAALSRIIWTYELARRLKGTGIKVNAFAPSPSRTKLYQHFPLITRSLINLGRSLYAHAPEQTIKLAVSLLLKEGGKANGRYFVKNRPEKSLSATYDRQVGQQFWNMCKQLTDSDIPSVVDNDYSALQY